MNWLRVVGLIVLLFFVSGCMELHVHVKLNEDGSARITERMRFSRRLLDRKQTAPNGESLVSCLSKANAEARAKQMGSAVRLIKHEQKELEDGSQESVAVFAAPDLNGIRLHAPFLGLKGHQKGHLQCVVEPCYRHRWASPDQPGWMAVHFHRRGFPGQPKAKKGERPVGPSPKELQRYRDFIPALADTLKDFHVKLTFESYNDLLAGYKHGMRWVKKRGTGITTGEYILLDLSGKKIDRWGQPILESEEAMVEVMSGHFGGPNVKAQLGRMSHSSRAPLLFPLGLAWYNWRRAFKPSAYHYKKYFDGRPVSQGGNMK